MLYERASLEFPVNVLKNSFHHLTVSFDWNYPWKRVDNKYCIPHTAKYVLVTTSDQCEPVSYVLRMSVQQPFLGVPRVVGVHRFDWICIPKTTLDRIKKNIF